MRTDGNVPRCASCASLDPDHPVSRIPALGMRARQAFRQLKYQLGLLPYRPRLIWRQLWLRQDEFHSSLDMDVDAMLRMNESDRALYLRELVRRRNAAHERDLAS